MEPQRTLRSGNIDSCWNRSTTDDYWWKGDGRHRTTGWTEWRHLGNGSYMYTETGSSNVLSTEILSPEIDLSALTAPEASTVITCSEV